MNCFNQLFKNTGLVGAICTVIGLPTIPLTAMAESPLAQSSPDLSSYPLVAQIPPSVSPTPQPSSFSIQPPLPEELQPPGATVVPMNGMINIRLMNETDTAITYQVVGDTQVRTLLGKSSVMLQDLKTPTYVTFKRPDGGLLLIRPQASAVSGLLEATLDETANLDEDKSAMSIQKWGSVFLN